MSAVSPGAVPSRWTAAPTLTVVCPVAEVHVPTTRSITTSIGGPTADLHDPVGGAGPDQGDVDGVPVPDQDTLPEGSFDGRIGEHGPAGGLGMAPSAPCDHQEPGTFAEEQCPGAPGQRGGHSGD